MKLEQWFLAWTVHENHLGSDLKTPDVRAPPPDRLHQNFWRWDSGITSFGGLVGGFFWIVHNLFIHSPVDGYLAITNQATMAVGIQVFVWISVS